MPTYIAERENGDLLVHITHHAAGRHSGLLALIKKEDRIDLPSS